MELDYQGQPITTPDAPPYVPGVTDQKYALEAEEPIEPITVPDDPPYVEGITDKSYAPKVEEISEFAEKAIAPDELSSSDLYYLGANDITNSGLSQIESEKFVAQNNWVKESLANVDSAVLDYENFLPGSTNPVKNRALIRATMEAELGYDPPTIFEYETSRNQAYKQLFGKDLSKDLGDPEQAFVSALTNRAVIKKEDFEFYEKVDRQATLSAILGDGLIELQFGESVKDDPAFIRQKDNAIRRWAEIQEAISDQYGDMIPKLRKTFRQMQSGDEWITQAGSVARTLNEQDKTKFLQVLRDLAVTYPTKEIESGFKKLGLNLKKSGRGVSGAIDAAIVGTGDIVREGGTVSFADLFGGGEWYAKEQERKAADAKWAAAYRKEQDFVADVRRIFEEDYDPIRPLAEKGSTLRAVEEGVYAIPGAVTTTAMAFVPIAGMTATYGTIREFERQKYRGRLIENGVSREKAAEIAEALSTVSAAPQVLLEKLQANIVGGKSPIFSKVLGKVDGLLKTKATRFTGRFVAASLGETTIELMQELTSETVQDLASELQKEIPDIEWRNGKDGYFDGYFNKTITTFVAVAPLSFIPAARGMSADNRAAAIKTTSPLVRKAWGFKPEDNVAIDDAKTPSETTNAVENALKNRDPQSQSAKEATEELEQKLKKEQEALKKLEDSGVIPSVRTSKNNKGFEVYDAQTDAVISYADTATEATDAVLDTIKMRENATQDVIDEMSSLIEAAKQVSKETGVTQEISPTQIVTPEMANKIFPESARRIAEESKLIEVAEGGTGAVTEAVFNPQQIVTGVAIPKGIQGRIEDVTKLYGGSNIFTLVHERSHHVRRELIARGELSEENQISFFRKLNAELKGRKTKTGQSVEFKGLDGDIVTETALDEAWAHFAEIAILRTRNGKKSKLRSLLNKNLSAMVRANVPGARQFKAFIRAMKDFFALNLTRAAILQKAARDGRLDEAEMQEFEAMVLGETLQEQHEEKVLQSREELIGQEGPSFSVTEDFTGVIEANKAISKTVYLKNKTKFQEAIKNGTIETGVDVFSFSGMDMFLHAPDFAFAGEVKVGDETVFEGKGGVYYPVLFSEGNYFWASTESAVKKMVKDLNEIGRRNKGKVLMGLVSSPADKMFSSTLIARGMIDFFVELSSQKQFGLSASALNKAIKTASQVSDKGKSFDQKIFLKAGLEQNVKTIKELLDAQKSSFGLRKNFSLKFAEEISNYYGKLATQESAALAGALLGESNINANADIKKGKLSKASIIQALGERFSEDFTKEQLSLNTGEVYAVIEFDGEVGYEKSAKHESYPFTVVGKGKNKVKVNVLSEAHQWTDLVTYSENVEFIKDKKVIDTAKKGDRVSDKRKTSVMPPSAGVTFKPLKITRNENLGEGTKLSFSIASDKMATSLVTDVTKRIKDPEARAEMFQRILNKITGIKRDVKSLTGSDINDINRRSKIEALEEEKENLKEIQVEVSEVSKDRVDEIKVELGAIDQAFETDVKKLKKQHENKVAKIGEDIVAKYNHRIEAAKGIAKTALVKEAKATQSERLKAERKRFSDEKKLAKAKIATEKANLESQLKTAEFEVRRQQAAREFEVSKEITKLEAQIADLKAKSNVSDIRDSLVALDAIVVSLPVELRGKVGGFTQISKLNTEEKRIEFLLKRMEKVDAVVETWIKSEYQKQIKKLFDRAKPKKDSKGILKSKIAAEYADRAMEIEKLSKMSAEELGKKTDAIQKEMEGEVDPETMDQLVNDLVEFLSFGNIKGMNAMALDGFYRNLNAVVETGKTLKEIADAEFKEEAEEVKAIVNNDVTGGKGKMLSSEAKLRKKERQKSVVPLSKIGAENIEIRGLSDFHRKNISFEWLMNNLSRENKEVGTLASETHKRLSTMVHVSTHNEKNANGQMQRRYQNFLSSVFKGKKGLSLSNAIYESLMEEQEKTGVIRIDYQGKGAFEKKKLRVSNIEAVLSGETTIETLGLTKSEWESAKAKYDEIKQSLIEKSESSRQTKQEAENKKAKKAEREPKKIESDPVSLKGNKPIEYKSANVGTPDNLTLSQAQAINLTMLFRQEGLRDSMIHEGYTEDTMKQMEEFLTPESIEIRDWLTNEYEENYNVVNEVFKKANGISLPKTEFYSPARRIAEGKVKDMDIDSYGTKSMSVTPTFTISRTTNFAQVDQSADAISIYMEHMVQTNHYISWAKTVKMLRTVFNDKSVKQNVKDYAGSSLLSAINERLDWFADGGNRKATHLRWVDKLRVAHTYSSLSFNWGVGIKQLTSLPAYAFDMSFKDFAKYQFKFLKNPIANFNEMLKEQYVQTRFKEGYERDVIDGLKNEKGLIVKGLQFGMLTGKIGDIIPVIVGGWMAKQRSYDMSIKEGLSEQEARAKAKIDFEMITDRAQQAGDLKDLSSLQGGGSLFKMFTMYKTSPRQYYSNLYESFLDAKAGKKGSKKEFGRRLAIGQVILPLMFQFASDALRSFVDDDEDFEAENYLRAVLMGPLNGLFIAGDFAELGFSSIAGTRIWDEKIPILDGLTKAVRGLADIKNGEFIEGIDEVAVGIGKTMPSAPTYYHVIKRELKRFGIGD